MINPVKYFHTALKMTQIATADDISVLDVICCSQIGTFTCYLLYLYMVLYIDIMLFILCLGT